MALENLMDTKDAAAYLGVTTGRIRQLARAGTLRGVRVSLRAWVFEKSELDRFQAEERRGPGRPPKSEAGA